MKDIEKIKKDLYAFGKKYSAWEEILNSIKGDTITELFANISPYINWCRYSDKKAIELNSIFGNELIIEDGVLLCNCTNLTAITIPTSVVTISDYAFIYCRELTSIEIPNSVTSIRKYAFYNCVELVSVKMPKSVRKIGIGAFKNCHPELEIIRK